MSKRDKLVENFILKWIPFKRKEIQKELDSIIDSILTEAIAKSVVEPVVMQKIKKGGSGQPMKDFEKAFYFNWRTKFCEDEMDLFYRVRKWFGEWCTENISNFSA